jgi:flagellar biosynthesis chaperone FliJ
LSETPSKLDQIIKKQKEAVEKMDFYDEESFNIYLEETKKLKILENQKKYLM